MLQHFSEMLDFFLKKIKLGQWRAVGRGRARGGGGGSAPEVGGVDGGGLGLLLLDCC
jgi:hypothetical protein